MPSMKRRIVLVVSLGVLVFGSDSIAGCSSGESSSPIPKCVAGSTHACLCLDGRSGVQSCNGAGTYDPCVCSDADSGSDVESDLGTDLGTDVGGDLGTDLGTDSTATDSSVSDADAVADSGSDVTDGGSVSATSCAVAGDGRTNCGSSGSDNCCTSIKVPGNSALDFSRLYDGHYSGRTDPSFKTQLSAFRLDKYEVTVGRFRQYVTAVIGGWKPVAGSGKHTHLNGGKGLAGATFGAYEAGWDPAWTTPANFPSSAAAWDTLLAGTNATWTSTAGANEKMPINYITWFDAAAFCIWDGGFLPSDAEWNFAGAGGTEHRCFPWSSPYPPGSFDCTDDHTVFCGTTCKPKPVATKSPLGDAKWGHIDMAGNVWEWVADWFVYPLSKACVDCADTSATGLTRRVARGGGYGSSDSGVAVNSRYDFTHTARMEYTGVRCARTP